jgi:hypothetical protein
VSGVKSLKIKAGQDLGKTMIGVLRKNWWLHCCLISGWRIDASKGPITAPSNLSSLVPVNLAVMA